MFSSQSSLTTIERGPKFYYTCDKGEAMEIWKRIDERDDMYFESYYDTKDFDFLKNGVMLICRTECGVHADTPNDCKRFWISRRNLRAKEGGIVYDETVSDTSLDDLLSQLEEKFHFLKPKNFCALRVFRFEGGCLTDACDLDDCCSIDMVIELEGDLWAETVCYSLLTCKHSIDDKEKAPSKSLVFFQKNLPTEIFDSLKTGFLGEKELFRDRRWWWKHNQDTCSCGFSRICTSRGFH